LGVRPVSVENNLNNIYNRLKRTTTPIPDTDITTFIQDIMDWSLFVGRESSCLHLSSDDILGIVKTIVNNTTYQYLIQAQDDFMRRLKDAVVTNAAKANVISYPFLYGYWSNPRFPTKTLIKEFGSDSSILTLAIKSPILQYIEKGDNKLGPLDGRKLAFIDQTHLTNPQLRDLIMNLFMLYAQYLFQCTTSARHYRVPVLITAHSITREIYAKILEVLEGLGHPITKPTDFFSDAAKKKRETSKNSMRSNHSLNTVGKVREIYEARGGYDLNNPTDLNCFINEMIIPFINSLSTNPKPDQDQDQDQDYYQQWIRVWQSLLRQFYNNGDTNLLFKDWTKSNLDLFLRRDTNYEIEDSPFDAIFKGFTCVQPPLFTFPKKGMYQYGIQTRDVDYITRYLGKDALPPSSTPRYINEFFRECTDFEAS
jgi:hypothetical protein